MVRFFFDAWNRWQAERRRIFYFRVGKKVRRLDPLNVVNRLTDLEPAWESMLAKVAHTVPAAVTGEMREIAEKGKRDAAADLVKVAREVFDMPALRDDGTGCTEAEVIGVVSTFIGFLGRLATAARPFTPDGRNSVPVPTAT